MGENPLLQQGLWGRMMNYLLARAKRDAARHQQEVNPEAVEAASRYLDTVVAQNTAHLRGILRTYGWPGRTMVGEAGASAACLLALLADPDRDFQRHCLDLMQKAGPDEVPSLWVAMLTDRLLVAEGEPQIYGTQFRRGDEGRAALRPIEDEAHVDERRAAFDLGDLETFLQRYYATFYPTSPIIPHE